MEIDVSVTNRKGQWWYTRKLISWVFPIKHKRVDSDLNALLDTQVKVFKKLTDLETKIRDQELHVRNVLRDAVDPKKQGEMYTLKADSLVNLLFFTTVESKERPDDDALLYRKFLSEFINEKGRPDRPARSSSRGGKTPAELNKMRGLGSMIDDEGMLIVAEHPEDGEMSIAEAVHRTNPPKKSKGSP